MKNYSDLVKKSWDTKFFKLKPNQVNSASIDLNLHDCIPRFEKLEDTSTSCLFTMQSER